MSLTHPQKCKGSLYGLLKRKKKINLLMSVLVWLLQIRV